MLTFKKLGITPSYYYRYWHFGSNICRFYYRGFGRIWGHYVSQPMLMITTEPKPTLKCIVKRNVPKWYQGKYCKTYHQNPVTYFIVFFFEFALRVGGAFCLPL